MHQLNMYFPVRHMHIHLMFSWEYLVALYFGTLLLTNLLENIPLKFPWYLWQFCPSPIPKNSHPVRTLSVEVVAMRHGTHPLAVFLAPRWGVQRRRLPSPHLPFLLMVQWKMTPLERKQVFGETQTTNFHDYGRKSICTFCMQKMSVYKIYYLFNEHFEYTHVTVYIYMFKICSYIYKFNIHIYIYFQYTSNMYKFKI